MVAAMPNDNGQVHCRSLVDEPKRYKVSWPLSTWSQIDARQCIMVRQELLSREGSSLFLQRQG